MEFKYIPKGVCSRLINLEIENDIIKNISFVGGCLGNTTGICNLVKGMKIDDVITKLQGIKCRPTTSCPDQLAQALIKYKQTKKD